MFLSQDEIILSECKECESCDGRCEENQTGSCNKLNGKCDCSCKDGYKEDKCEECKEGYWMSSSGEFNSTTVKLQAGASIC